MIRGPGRQTKRRSSVRGLHAIVRLGKVQLFIAAVAIVALTAGAPARAEPRSFELAIHNGQRSGDVRTFAVEQGDEVTLRITADQPIEIHLHGYDIEQAASPGQGASMHFTARSTGRFPIEIHGPGKERVIGYLEVHPR